MTTFQDRQTRWDYFSNASYFTSNICNGYYMEGKSTFCCTIISTM